MTAEEVFVVGGWALGLQPGNLVCLKDTRSDYLSLEYLGSGKDFVSCQESSYWEATSPLPTGSSELGEGCDWKCLLSLRECSVRKPGLALCYGYRLKL